MIEHRETLADRAQDEETDHSVQFSIVDMSEKRANPLYSSLVHLEAPKWESSNACLWIDYQKAQPNFL